MALYLVVMCMFACLFSVILPSIYLKEKRNVLSQCSELEIEQNQPLKLPVFANFIFIMPVIMFYLSGDMILSIFFFFFAVVAYTDASARWIPDCIIYALLVISMIASRTTDLETACWSIFFYIIPALILSFYGQIVRNETWIASGDYYVFPAVALMILPQYAAGIMLINLFIVLLVSRWVSKVPLVTVAFITFTGYQLCLLSGVLSYHF